MKKSTNSRKSVGLLTIALLLASFLIALLSPLKGFAGDGRIIPSDSSQEDFLKTYKLLLYKSYANYRFTGSHLDKDLFPEYGEFSIYWANSGANAGSFIMPETIHSSYSSVSSLQYSDYDWSDEEHYSLQYRKSTKNVAIFKSSITSSAKSVSWEAIYFKNMFDSYLYGDVYYYLDEEALGGTELHSATKFLIIPAFTVGGDDAKYYIDSIFRRAANLKEKLDAFLARGGTIYAEGNAVYFIEKLGYLDDGAVDFSSVEEADPESGFVEIEFNGGSNPLRFTERAAGKSLYASSIPEVEVSGAEVIAETREEGYPAVFVLKGSRANGGRIVCNLGLPTVGGASKLASNEWGARQYQWALNALLYAYSTKVDVTRSLYNDLADTIIAGKNAVAFDKIDTFEVRVKIRNLGSSGVSGIEINESIRYFEFVDVQTSGVEYEINGSSLKLKNISMSGNSEKAITYRLRTPEIGGDKHSTVDKYISWSSYIYASYNTTKYEDELGENSYNLYRNYVDIMFSADIAADADLNWKNFLGLYYQPFKVFMIMENKERTDAEETVYTQYIPKDVPFYWTDKEINIPVLKTPGGKYVDVLRGSADENNPQFDMDSDGHPDVWLDTATIYPKGYAISEEEVYWLNPWEHLRSGDAFLYEDIDHDGVRAQDIDGDGVVDVEEPGDKIRVWKVTWNIGEVDGYQFYDPYCSYEIWVDPPDLVKLAAGVGEAYGKLDENVGGMFYPYTSDAAGADLSDTTWTHWMERDDEGNIIWKQFIYQSIHNYEGFTFIDTAEANYSLKPTDRCVGTVPQPHREFIAVLSLGGEEIDMTHPTPQQSLYSKIDYKTIFNESKTTPIRTTYTYYAPLPNPLQFEYLTNNYTITDPDDGDTLRFLPAKGDAKITFDVDASTEYTYYWIRNVGHDVDYNDPSAAVEGDEELGDGVFGYMIYDIPKGLGDYEITLPKNADGSFDIDEILTVDGAPFSKWLDNPNTRDEVEIWEDAFQYRVYIPQLLIPPALDDDNFDGVDDWIDDRGDRFCSATGFLHDRFMLDDGEDWRDYPETPFQDDIYGQVDSGWYHGADNTYGDDFFENLGKTHFKINALYEGKGKEGPVKLSNGGWLVVEEIFGGSPWVIFSHVLSGYAKGVDYRITSSASPSSVKYGTDTTYIKHVVEDKSEPRDFDINFDPYHVSWGYGLTTITTSGGGKDPCNLVSPPIETSSIVDPDVDEKTVTLIPYADPDNPDLTGFPKQETGTFVQFIVEISNGTDDNWINTTVEPNLPANLKNSEIVMQYVAYPRPLVPAKVDPATGEIIHTGDEIGSFRAGWRFNQPENEVLVKLGNTLNLMQPTRRAYFIFLLKVDPTLNDGIYEIDFELTGTRKHYDGSGENSLDFEVPPLMFSVTEKNAAGVIQDFQRLVIGQGDLDSLASETTQYFRGLENVRWSHSDVNHSDFESLSQSLPAKYDAASGKESIDLSQFKNFPSVENHKFYILEQGEVNSLDAPDDFNISQYENLQYSFEPFGDFKTRDDKVSVSSAGPKIRVYKRVSAVNGRAFEEGDSIYLQGAEQIDIETTIDANNFGNDIAENVVLNIGPGVYFEIVQDSLPDFCSLIGNKIEARLGTMIPGETKKIPLHFGATKDACEGLYDSTTIIRRIDISYKGKQYPESFAFADRTIIDFPAADFNLSEFAISKEIVDYDEEIVLTAKIENGLTSARDVAIDFYAIINEIDTTLIERREIDDFPSGEISNISLTYTTPRDIRSIEFFAIVDGDDKFAEFCENNNSSLLIVKLDVPFSVDAGDDITICPDSCAAINANISGGIPPYEISWSPESGLDKADTLNPKVCLSEPGEYEYILTVKSPHNFSDGSDTLIVEVLPYPALSAADEKLDFGALDACSSSKTDSVEVSNAGELDLTIDSLAASEGFFAVAPQPPFELKSGESRFIAIKFTPQSEGISAGTLEVFAKPCGAALAIELEGEKLELLVAAQPSGVDFGTSQCLPFQKDTTIVVKNKGTGVVEFDFAGAAVDAPFELISPLDATSAEPGEEIEVSIAYSPTKAGVGSGELKIPYDAGSCSDTLAISLGATHREPEIELSVSRIDFLALLGCETSADTIITIKNKGNIDVSINSISPPLFSADLPITVEEGATQDLEIKFTPDKNGDFDQTITLRYGPCDKSVSIPATGSKKGVVFSAPDTIDIGTLVYCAEKTLTKTFKIANNSEGGIDGSVKSVDVGAYFNTNVQAGDALPNAAQTEFEVEFAPTYYAPEGELFAEMKIILSPCDVAKTIILKGTKTDAEISGGSDTTDFGSIVYGTSSEATVYFENTGTAFVVVESLDENIEPFEILSVAPQLPASLAPGEKIAVEIRYNGDERGVDELDLFAYGSNPCEIAAFASLRGETFRKASAKISVGEKQAEPGEIVLIPISLDESEFLLETGINKVNVVISLDASILYPLGETPQGEIANGERTIEINDVPVEKSSGALVQLEFAATLGESECTDISVDSVYWSGGSAETSVKPGSFCLVGICREGGDRLFKDNGVVTLFRAKPNPATESVTIEFETIEKGPVKIFLFDATGAKAAELFDENAAPGRRKIEYDLSELGAGVYRCVLQTESHVLNQTITIIK